jgi:hypothetical protein
MMPPRLLSSLLLLSVVMSARASRVEIQLGWKDVGLSIEDMPIHTVSVVLLCGAGRQASSLAYCCRLGLQKRDSRCCFFPCPFKRTQRSAFFRGVAKKSGLQMVCISLRTKASQERQPIYRCKNACRSSEKATCCQLVVCFERGETARLLIKSFQS